MTALERAARALEAAHIECAKASGNPIEGGEDYVAMARAVLMAVREPGLGGMISGPMLADEVFRELIDAILEADNA